MLSPQLPGTCGLTRRSEASLEHIEYEDSFLRSCEYAAMLETNNCPVLLVLADYKIPQPPSCPSDNNDTQVGLLLVFTVLT
jgi:hypothetical protein